MHRTAPYARQRLGPVLAMSTCLACGTSSDSDTAEGATPVELTTRDGLILAADHYPGAEGAAGVVLLHMNPSAGNDRSNWPALFVEQLHARDWHVLALDRRGSGASEGVSQDAFEGDSGRYDVEAAASFLEEAGAADLVLIGASNGTTSLLDYAVWAPDEGLTEPTTAVLLTGGSYTENQTDFSDFPAIATMLCYASDEAEWSEAQMEGAPDSWSFEEYADGGHGTRLFDAIPEIGDDIENFVHTALTTP